jgi:predicted  nucleic acid-binding Zn-ribbon protein
LNRSLIETLALLQEIDRQNRERQLEIMELEREAAELDATIESRRAVVDGARSEASVAQVRRRELEALLQEEERKIKDRRMRLSRIRNEQELQAAQREIDANKESNSRLEEELLTLLEQSEALEGGLREAEAELTTLEERAGTLHAHADSRASQLRAEIGSNQGEREAIAGRLSVSVRKKYEQIFAKRGGIAVVEIRGGSCQGCNMTIPPQLCNEVRKSQDLHLCPSCHRILFWREEAVAIAGAIEK